MPYPHEHACRLRDPADFVPRSFRSLPRRHEGKPYRVIIGKVRGHDLPTDPMVEQTYRYPADLWTPEEAERHGRAHGGTWFEPATGARLRSAGA
jgi:hypothetical protein